MESGANGRHRRCRNTNAKISAQALARTVQETRAGAWREGVKRARNRKGACGTVVGQADSRRRRSLCLHNTQRALYHGTRYITLKARQLSGPDNPTSMSTALDLKALNIFIRQPVSQDMIHKLVVTTLQVIPCQSDKDPKLANNGKPLPSLMTFISRLVRYTNVYTGTLMTTLVYLDRLRRRLPKTAQGLPCTRHRIFLSCLVLASKFHNDSLPKNVHWANYTDGLFSLKDLNLMERQLLYLLNWDMRVTSEQMCVQLDRFLEPIRADLVKSAQIKSYMEKQRAACGELSRSSSAASALSLGHVRSESDLSASSAYSHGRLGSSSSVESVSPVLNKENWSSAVDPRIEMAAQTEERKLNKMLNAFCRR